jgi:phage terminase large subunit-like protein
MYMDARQPPTDIAGYDPVATAGDCHYDAEAAEKAVAFFYKCLSFTRGHTAGEPFKLEPWQADIVRTLFGWKRPNGTRRYRETFVEIPRKNGKTVLASGIALYVLLCDAEPEAQCYCAAGDREQASLVFNSAASMVRKAAFLDKRCKVRDSTKRIIFGGSFIRAIPANEGAVHGYDPHLIVGDELHVWPGRLFFDGLRSGSGARTQPLEFYITTAGYDRHSVCFEQYRYACQVRDMQIVDPSFLPVIYEAKEEDDWQDQDIWRKANPNLGVSVHMDFLERECAKASQNPALENTFRRLYLNQWTSQESRWLQMEKWRGCEWTDEPLDPALPAFGGLDLSSNVDVSAWVLAQRHNGGWRLRGHYFIPEGRMNQAEKRDGVPYSLWRNAGLVTATPGDAIDYDYIHTRILADAEHLQLTAVGYDPWNAEATRIFLENEGVTMVKMRQGVATLSGPCKELERSVIEGVLDHGNDPVLAWMAENVQVKTDENGNIRPVKPDHAGSAKRIDGIVAAVMAIGVGLITEPVQEAGICIL